MDGAKEDLVDMFIVHTTEEIQVLRIPHVYFRIGFFFQKNLCQSISSQIIDKFVFATISINEEIYRSKKIYFI